MKRNNLKWVLPMAALCLLTTACSNDNDNISTDGSTPPFTIDCNIGATATTPGTRAGVTPNNDDQSKEAFIWHEEDWFLGFILSDGNVDLTDLNMFTIDQNYNNAQPSSSASFSGQYGFEENKTLLALYAANTVRFKDQIMVSLRTNQTQTGRNSTQHLSQSMNMYASAKFVSTGEKPKLTFHHLTSLLRFTVTNKNASACRITNIKAHSLSDESLFGAIIGLTKENWENETVPAPVSSSPYCRALELNLQEPSATEPSANVAGISLSAGNAIDNSNMLNAYMSTYAGIVPLRGQELQFTITVTDANGENPRNYTSLALNADQIINDSSNTSGATSWVPGKRYWFDLVLDDELTVALHSVTPMPGWDNEADL